ncbi:MAG: DNA-deoxyinosine glycosylase [Dokdonella sp.]
MSDDQNRERVRLNIIEPVAADVSSMPRALKSETIICSFPPLVPEGCRVLILGSMPGQRSLTQNEYYAHPRNLFWPLMGELYGAGRELPYSDRVIRLNSRRVGVWDVLAECDRPGSLDGAILPDSEIANDIPGLLQRQTDITIVALNGGKAQQSFARHVEPKLDPATRQRLKILSMPSTSPANAGIPLAIKRAQWQRLLEAG